MAKKREAGGGVARVAIEVPLAAEIVGAVPHQVNLQFYTAEARAGMARLRAGLVAAGITRAGGLPIESNADAVRWLLEQLGAAETAGS